MRFINNPDFSTFIKSLIYDFKILIICDSLWFDKFHNEKLINKKKNNIKILHQSTFIDGSLSKDKFIKTNKNTKTVIINMSGLTDLDILFVNNVYNYIEQIEIANLIE